MKVLKLKSGFKRSFFKKIVVINDGNCISFITNGILHSKKHPTYYSTNSRGYFWNLNDKQHRTDGPAISYVGNHKSWWYKNKCYGYNDCFTKSSWKRFIKLQVFK